MGNYVCGNLYNLELGKLTPNPDQPRKVFSEDEIKKLADSINEKGLLQPILVKQLEDEQIIIVSGERRFRAHQFLGREIIPAWFTTGDAEELALVENLVREDLSAIETAEALEKLQKRFDNKTQADLAKLIGKAESTVSEILSLNKLPNDIRDEIRNNNRYALRELKEIAKKKSEKSQRAFFEKYKERIAEKPSHNKTKYQKNKFDPDYHRVKLTKTINYLSSMRESHKLALLRPLHHEMTELKNIVNELFNDLSIMFKNFDASKPVFRKKNNTPETLSGQPKQNDGG